MSYFDDVGAFHERMKLPLSAEWCCRDHRAVRPPALLEDKDLDYRMSFLFEEIKEFLIAQGRGDLAGVSDALVDIIYIVLGTAHYMGIPFNAIWEEVHRANMTKRPWKEGDPIKPRNTTGLEVVKPEGWRPPDIDGVIREFQVVHGFRKPSKSHPQGCQCDDCFRLV